MIYFITGASGVGKTTLVANLKKKYSEREWDFFHFDSITIPSLEEMEAEYGSGSEWQKAMTYKWIDRLVNEMSADTIVFEGQVNLEFIRDGFSNYNFNNYMIFLIDCTFQEMTLRLTQKRNQPELLTEEMKNWLDFLRNQALRFKAPIIDTSNLSERDVVNEFEKYMNI
jgi:adenylate kinase family enzyme